MPAVSLLFIFGMLNSLSVAEFNRLALLSCSVIGRDFTVGIGNDSPTDVVAQVRNLTGFSERKLKVASLVTTTSEYGYSYWMLSDIAEDMPGTLARVEGKF